MPKKFDQAAKDRVVRLVEDRVLAEGLSLRAACEVVAFEVGGVVACCAPVGSAGSTLRCGSAW